MQYYLIATKANKGEENAYTILYKLGTTLGFTFEKAALSEDELSKATEHVSEALGQKFNSMDEIIELRKQARAEKNWDIADKIRIALDESGIILKDTKEGTTIEAK